MTRTIDLAEFQLGTLVETGTGDGSRVIEAIRFGFRTIYSIEIDEETIVLSRTRIQDALTRFNASSRVATYHGDSSAFLFSLCKLIQGEQVDLFTGMATFWLDARPLRRPNGEIVPGTGRYPLLQELFSVRAAFREALMSPIILINGIAESLRGMQLNGTTVTLDTIKSIIWTINPEYSFEIVRIRSGSSEENQYTEDVFAAFPAWFTETRSGT